MTSPASKEWPCCFLRSLGPIPALPPVAVWPRVNYCTSGLICKVGGGEHTRQRKATRSKEAKRKLQVKKAKDWLEAQRLTGGQVALAGRGRTGEATLEPARIVENYPPKLLQGIMALLQAKASLQKLIKSLVSVRRPAPPLSRRWAGPRGGPCALPPLSSHTAA